MSAAHDPLCWTDAGRYGVICICDLIARVRADERRQARQRVEALPLLPYRGEWAIKYAEAAAAAGGDA